jgi:phosphoribosyl 1,2-cyclic phosphate phosphodiesterase
LSPLQGTIVCMQVIVLGSGTSHGVPMIGCDCAVCTSADPHNKRTRPSIAVRDGEHVYVVDTAPEFRLQSLAAGLNRVDAVFITHTHADHIFGMDDIRRFNDLTGSEIPVYGSKETLKDIQRIFRYVFTSTPLGGGKPRISLHEAVAKTEINGMTLCAIPVMHGEMPILGYRFNDFAYVTDVSSIPQESMVQLKGLDTLIMDAVRYRPHATHFGLYQTLDVIESLKPRRAFITHISHRLEHESVNRLLPSNVKLAYDGMRLDL